MPSNNKQIFRSAGTVGGLTLLSRIFGLIRDVVIASFFSPRITDTFFVAIRIPNLLRRLFAEGALTISFIPIYKEYLSLKKRYEARELAYIMMTLTSILLCVISILGILLAPLIVRLFAWGFYDDPQKFNLTVLLTRICFPYIFLIGMVALSMGILNSHGHFFAPAASPIFFNIAIISGAIFLSPHLREPSMGLAIGVLIGGGLQLFLQFPFLRRLGVGFRFNFNIHHTGVRRIGSMMGPAAFGMAVYQINILINTLLASFLPDGSVSYLYYADRLVELPFGIFAIAFATAALPTMSEYTAKNDIKGLGETLSYSLRITLFTILPSMVGLIVLSVPIISVIFQRGEFGVYDTRATAYALCFYSVGLAGFAGVRILVSAFYSMKDTLTPVKIASLCLVINVILGIVLMRPMAHGGLALATSLSSMVNVILLSWILRRRIGGKWLMESMKSAVKILFASTIMGAILYYFIKFVRTPEWWLEGGDWPAKALILAGIIISGGLIFILLCYIFRIRELRELFAKHH